MKRIINVTVVAIFIVFSTNLIGKEQISIKSLPPVVIKTIPQSGSMNVDPAITSIEVTFSKEMQTKNMWSWIQISKESFPKINGDIKFKKDKRTCVLPTDLEPNKTYAIWVNTEKYNAFRDITNNPSVPYLIVFKTGIKTKK